MAYSCAVARVGLVSFLMPRNLKRYIERGDLHCITFFCYQWQHFLASLKSKNLAVTILGEVRAQLKFALVGYVPMPDHVDLLMNESAAATPAKVVQIFKRQVSRRLRTIKRTPKLQLRLRSPMMPVSSVGSGSAAPMISTFIRDASSAKNSTTCTVIRSKR